MLSKSFLSWNQCSINVLKGRSADELRKCTGRTRDRGGPNFICCPATVAERVVQLDSGRRRKWGRSPGAWGRKLGLKAMVSTVHQQIRLVWRGQYSISPEDFWPLWPIQRSKSGNAGTKPYQSSGFGLRFMANPIPELYPERGRGEYL